MSKQFWLILPLAVAIGAGAVWFLYSSNQAAQVDLAGSVLKVRTYPLSPESSLVIADFRVTNGSEGTFVVESLEMELDRADSEPLQAALLTRGDIERVFAYEKLSGPQYNDPLIIQDQIGPGETWDRMAAGRIDLPESGIQARTNLRIRIHEIGGRVSEIAEHPDEAP